MPLLGPAQPTQSVAILGSGAVAAPQEALVASPAPLEFSLSSSSGAGDDEPGGGRNGGRDGLAVEAPAGTLRGRHPPPGGSPRRLAVGYHTVHPGRLLTDSSLVPFKEAEARINVPYEESLIRNRIMKKYEGRVSRRFRAPVTRVPWSLVDELEAERIKWENEKASFDTYIRARMMGQPPKKSGGREGSSRPPLVEG